MANILIVEDEPAIADLISLSLEHAGHRSQKALTAEEAEARIRTALPDVVLLDWMLPGQSGLALARKLRAEARTKTLPILFITARAEEEDKVHALEIGADDYITKPFSPKEVNARIKAVLRRRAPEVADDVVEFEGLRLDPAVRRVSANGRSIPLGPTEFRLLQFLMTHPNRVYSRGQLLDTVWGDHVYVEERTVDVHIRRLRLALSASEMDRLVQTVRGSGYYFGRTPS